jgi:hypothetical protein
MQAFEYKVVPAPHKGTKAKGVKTPEQRFANSIEITLNELAAQGWEYQRAELLPSDERAGLTGSTTNWRNVLVFRRALVVVGAHAGDSAAPSLPAETAPLAAQPTVPAPVAPVAPAPAAPPLTATAGDPQAPAGAAPIPGAGAAKMQADDGVEELSPVAGMTAALKARAMIRTSNED